MKKALMLFVFLVLAWGIGTAGFAEEELLITDFEKHPNCLGGQVGVFGAGNPDWSNTAEPYSWYYTQETKDYKKENVVSGKQSFRLVNGNSPDSDVGWASFGLDLGPILDASTVPIKVEPVDVSGYKYLVFWAKGEKGGEKLVVNFRDDKGINYMPQFQYKVEKPLTTKWQRITIPLKDVYNVDFKCLVHTGLAFGVDADNEMGTIIYVDDFAFSNNRMPR